MRVYRLHLKTDCINRKELIDFCINSKKIAIGWSYIYKEHTINDFAEYSEFAKQESKNNKIPQAIKSFAKLEVNDLVWIRDLDGVYYLCRVLGKVKPYCDYDMDIGCLVDVDIQKIDTNVPGKIVRSFIPGRIIQGVNDKKAADISMMLYNKKSKKEVYKLPEMSFDFFTMIHPLDLEELVLAYIQVEYDYYLSKNSISGISSTVKIEGELYPRKKGRNEKSAVLQVKSGYSEADVSEYKSYIEQGKRVFFFFESDKYPKDIENVTYIKRADLIKFLEKNKEILPPWLKELAELCGH